MPSPNYRRDPKFVSRVQRLYRRGESCSAIAKKLGVSRQTISAIGKDRGWQWGARNIEKAHEANRAYGAERRATQVLAMAGEVDGILERFTKPHVVFSFGGRDNVYRDHCFDRPDSRTLFDLSRSIQALTTSMKTLQNFDATDGGNLAAVDEYLAKAKGGA